MSAASLLSQLPSTKTLKVAIFRTSSIGDVVLATSCIVLLSRLGCSVQIFWIGRPPSLQLITTAYPSVIGIALEKRQGAGRLLEVAAQLKECDLFVDLQCNIRSRMLGALIKNMYGVKVKQARKMQFYRSRLLAEARLRGRRSFSPPAIRVPEFRQIDLMVRPVVDGLCSILPNEITAGAQDGLAFPRLTMPESDPQRPWQKELRLGTWLAVAPGASHVTKRAPIGKWCEIITAINKGLVTSNSGPVGILYLGDDADREFALSIQNVVGWEGQVLNLAGRLSLWETAQALNECVTLISNDSSLAHIAEAVGIPVTVLFGPTVEAYGFAPWRPNSMAVSALTGCRPCSKHGKIPCRFGDQKCFEDIAALDISVRAIELLVHPNQRDA